ncbi:MAG TPA: outer membrane protein transport protein [Kofleriaceae bacterium]
MKALAILLLLCATAQADPLDEIGFGAAASGMAGSRGALASGAEAAHSNPAGIARIGRPELLVGYQYSHERLELDGHDAGVLDAHGTSVGIAVPFVIRNVQLATGVALYLPDQFLARLQLSPITEPHFVRFEHAAQRIVVEPVAALAFGHFAIGGGASLLADARSNDLTFDVGVVGGEKQGRASLDVAMPVRAAPLVGVWWRPAHMIELGATFRGELSLDLALDIQANVLVPGVVMGDVSVALRSVSYYTPMRGALAAALHPTEDLAITGELAWERWSALGSGVPDLRVLVALDLAPPPPISTMQPPASFKNIFTSRLGAEWTTGMLRLRAGAAYLPSPVPAQTGLTSFADGARTLATLGLGVRIPPGKVLLQPIDFDLGIGWQHIRHDLVQKDQAMVPGGAFSSGGNVVQANITSTVRF